MTKGLNVGYERTPRIGGLALRARGLAAAAARREGYRLKPGGMTPPLGTITMPFRM